MESLDTLGKSSKENNIMKWKTITNKTAEIGFITVNNISGSAYSAGQVVVWDFTNTSETEYVEGFSTMDPSSTTGALVVGLAHTAIPDDEKGLVQVYGIDDDAIMTRGGSASNDGLAIGDIMDIYSASSCITWAKNGGAVVQAASNAVAVPPMIVAAAAVASGGASSLSTTTGKVFLRML